MVSAYLNVALDQTIPGLLPEITPRSNRFRTNQHNLLLRASAFRQQEQRNRNTGKQEHLKTGWSETKTHQCWETGTSDNSSNMKTGASENRIIWNQNTGMQENRNTRKQEHLKTGASGNRNAGKLENRNSGKQELWKTGTSEKGTPENRITGMLKNR